MRVNFDPDSVNWRAFFEVQRGGNYWFEGLPYQRGYGIGSMIGTLLQFLTPVVKTLGAHLGHTARKTTSDIVKDIAAGANVAQTLKTRGKQGLRTLEENLAQTGGGRKRIKGKRNLQKASLVGKLVRKRAPRIDYLGTY